MPRSKTVIKLPADSREKELSQYAINLCKFKWCIHTWYMIYVTLWQTQKSLFAKCHQDTSLTKTQCFTREFQEIKFIFIKQRWPYLKDIITEILNSVKMTGYDRNIYKLFPINKCLWNHNPSSELQMARFLHYLHRHLGPAMWNGFALQVK